MGAVTTMMMMLGNPPPAVAASLYRLYSWGRNNYGQLGLGTYGDINSVSSPVQVGALTNWKQVSNGYNFTISIKTNNTLWSWGNNTDGQLGLGDTVSRSSPVQIGSLTSWSKISTGCRAKHNAAITSDGKIWTWGNNDAGELGLNTYGIYNKRSLPTQVGALTTWLNVSVNDQNTAAIKTDNTLWVWGSNFFGELGQNNITDRSSPVQVGTGTDWSSVSVGLKFMIAIKTDGSLWSWGTNTHGQLGRGYAGGPGSTGRSSPVQVGALTNWAKVSAFQQVLAIKTDGTLWAWGRGDDGGLGINTGQSRSSPVQVGTLTDWADVVAGGGNSTIAVKTDGTLWVWGYNNKGQLGLGDTVTRSSPVQVGSIATWVAASTGNSHSVAIIKS